MRINWLHLSDLRCDPDGSEQRWPEIREAFARDLEVMTARLGSPDILLLTGNLAERGCAGGYAMAGELLEWIFARLGRRLPLFAVPGSSDISAPAAADLPRYRWVSAYSRREHGALWNPHRGSNEFLADIEHLFARYLDFASEEVLPGLRGEVYQGHLPGELAASVEINGLKLGLLGINSAWSQLGARGAPSRVVLDPRQLQALLPEEPAAFRARHHLVVLLQHHAPRWLEDRAGWAQRVLPAADLVLHGGGANPLPQLRAGERPCLAALPLCGQRGVARVGYTWGRLALEPAGVMMRSWQRDLLCSCLRPPWMEFEDPDHAPGGSGDPAAGGASPLGDVRAVLAS